MSGERAAEAIPLGEETSLSVLLHRVWTHLGLVLSICIAVVVVVLFATLTTRPEYEGRVRLLLESSAPKVVDVKRVVEPRFETDVYLRTQIQVIKSRGLAKRVISALNLEEHKEFQPDSSAFWDWYQDGYLKLRGAIQSWFRRILAPGNGSSPKGPEDKQNAVVDNFLSRLRVASVRGTRLLTLSFRGYYPEAVAAIANAVADQFIEQTLEFEFSSTRRATKWLEGQLAELKKAAERSERALQAYRQAENLVGVEVAESREVITGALGTLSQGIMNARSERIAAEAAYREFKSYLGGDRANAKLESIPSGLLGRDTLIANLQINLADAQREYANLSRRYKPKHPAIVQLRSKIEFLKRRLRQEISQAVKKLETRFLVAQQRERSLMASLEKEKARVIRLGGKTVRLGILKREVESNRKLYELFLTRMKETNLATNLRMTNIQIVDRAVLPDAPVRPKKGRNLILAMILGLFLGVGAAFGVEYSDTSLRDPDETERILGIPVMATVDHMGNLARKRGELVVLEKRSSGYEVDFFNTLRTNLLYSAPAEQRRVLLVTSSTPKEGKTFLASNLALALANLGEEVLLIDADLRWPRMHNLFGLNKEPGLTDFLVGRNALEEVLHATGKDHLSLIPAGHHSPNPVDLLSSDRLQGLFEELQGRFQYIVVDSPPVLSVADPLTLVPGVNGVIVVTWAGRTPRRNVIQAFRKLKEVRDSRVFFGLVMNRIVHRRGSSYYYYHRRYRYYYSKSQ